MSTGKNVRYHPMQTFVKTMEYTRHSLLIMP